MPRTKSTTQNSPEVLPMFKTAVQMSRISGVGENTLRRLMAAGEIDFVQVGNRRLLTESALEDWFQRNKGKQALPATGE